MKINGNRIEMVRGDTETFNVRLRKGTEIIPLVTGDTVKLTVRRSWLEPVLFQKTVTAFEVDGTAKVQILPVDTAALRFGRHVFDFEFTFASGEVKTPFKGDLVIGEEATYV